MNNKENVLKRLESKPKSKRFEHENELIKLLKDSILDLPIDELIYIRALLMELDFDTGELIIEINGLILNQLDILKKFIDDDNVMLNISSIINEKLELEDLDSKYELEPDSPSGSGNNGPS